MQARLPGQPLLSVHEAPSEPVRAVQPVQGFSDVGALQMTALALVALHWYVPVQPTALMQLALGTFASAAQPPHALRAGALQVTAVVPLQTYSPGQLSVPVQDAPGAAASVVQPPHAFSAPQTLFEQQPFGHDVASQTQDPLLLHSCPVAHWLHAAPLTPHVVFPEVWQCWLESQQPGHDVPSQTHCPVALQCWPCAHAPHVLPPVPH